MTRFGTHNIATYHDYDRSRQFLGQVRLQEIQGNYGPRQARDAP